MYDIIKLEKNLKLLNSWKLTNNFDCDIIILSIGGLNMDIIKNPHDTLFKRTLRDKEVARDFLKNYLPENILDEVDLTDINIAKDSFVDKELKESFSDILYNVSINDRDGYIYLLFEHKSYLDKMTPVQLLSYITDIWELHENQSTEDKLPPIIPILIYHGKKRWSFGDQLSELIGDSPESIVDYIPDYRYLVYDFSEYSDSEIKGEIKLRIFLKLISHIFDDDFENGLRKVLPLMNKLQEKSTGMEYIETVVKYILNTGEEMSLQELNKKVKDISSEGSEFIMTIAEKLIEEGKREGRREAMEDMVIKLLKNKFNNLPKKYKTKIKGLNIEKLELIFNQLTDIDRLSELDDYLN